mgnify:CR=1 FL=1
MKDYKLVSDIIKGKETKIKKDTLKFFNQIRFNRVSKIIKNK